MPSTIRVLRPRATMVDGVLESTWEEVAGLSRVRCRIDVNFYRPGKDMPMPIQAGRAPDRVAVYWVAPGTALQPGDHLECVDGPIIGTWQVRTAPDRAQNMRHLHHLEGQCVEVAPSIASGSLSGSN